MTPEPGRFDLLELDVDARIHDVWTEAGRLLPDALEVAGPLMRAAYAIGYGDAAFGDRTLYTDNGYELPRVS